MAQQPSETEALQPHGEADPSRTQAVIANVTTEIARVIVGQDQLIERLLVALLTGQHALIEGAPGLAKTLTVSTLASTLKLSFSRIQFTPDLLPADITGTLVFQQSDGQFRLHRGPLFAERHPRRRNQPRTAKVQSALLEAMQERRSRSAAPATPCPIPSSCSPRKPDRARGHLPAARGATRPLHAQSSSATRPHSERSIIRRSLDEEDVEVQPAASQRDLEALALETRRVEVNERIASTSCG